MFFWRPHTHFPCPTIRVLSFSVPQVVGAKVVTNARSPGARCYGFVTMCSTDEATKCISHLHRTELHGRMISVERVRVIIYHRAYQLPLRLTTAVHNSKPVVSQINGLPSFREGLTILICHSDLCSRLRMSLLGRNLLTSLAPMGDTPPTPSKS